MTDGTKASVSMPSLAVVIPAYNASQHLAHTIEAIGDAVAASPFSSAEIVVVDDGSSDGTCEVAARTTTRIPVRVIRQDNQGRFAARMTGLNATEADFVLLIDSRVTIALDALAFVATSIESEDSGPVWNAHVDIDVRRNPYARFWRAITEVAWRRYYKDPRTTSYGLDEFDYFPKGTTCFFAPRAVLLEAGRVFELETRAGDRRRANDDGIVIRSIAAQHRIHISPSFCCVYQSRDDLRSFLSHSFHRGMVFVDGYFRPGTRYFAPLVVSYLAMPAAACLLIRHPRRAAALVVFGAGAGAATAVAAGARRDDAVALASLSPLFGVSYAGGLVAGLMSRRRGDRST